MSFFSSITKPFKKAWDAVEGAVSNTWNAVVDTTKDVVDLAAPLLGAGGGDIIAGTMNNAASAETNALQAALTREQIAYQKELAKNQIQWRVEDAKKAGLHPLAGLGVSSASYSPVSTNLTSPDYSFISDMGQNLNRAIMQGKTAKQRQQALDRETQLFDINLKKARAEADLAESTAMSARLQLKRDLSPPSPKVNQNQDSQLPSGSDAFSIRHIRDNDYDINFNQDYQGELGDEAGQFYNMLRKATRENAAVWTDPKSGVAYVFNRDTGWWNRLSALSPEEAERLLGKPTSSASGHMPLSSSHAVRNRHRYRY